MTISHKGKREGYFMDIKLNSVADKKQKKENSLFEAAYELFMLKGIDKTSIDDIVKKAGVAKGTFYLYFKDKLDILDKIVWKKNISILEEAINSVGHSRYDNFSDSIICFADYIIEFFKENKLLLKVMNRNFSWNIVKESYDSTSQDGPIKEFVENFNNYMKKKDHSVEYTEKTIFLIVDLVGSVCYCSIVLHQPDNIDNMKPILFDTVRKILA